MPDETPKRCRLVLVAPPGATADALPAQVADAIAGGDVASLILPQYDLDESSFQRLAEAVAPIAQQAGVAVILAGDSRVVGRMGADGIHMEGGPSDLSDAVSRWAGKLIVGAGGASTRDDALALGEAQPDYIFFGRFGMDTRPEPHKRNLALGAWWADVIEVPCIVLGGSEASSVEAVAATGAEFVALSSAVFGAGVDPRAAVANANAVLDASAPRFRD
jgi:thiamine-phosphate pyrophosphorylase